MLQDFLEQRMLRRVRKYNTVVYLLKARTVEPQQQPLLVNDSETTFISSHGRETDDGTTSVATQKIVNRQPLLGNGLINKFQRQRICMQQMKGVVCAGCAVELQDHWGNQVSSAPEAMEKKSQLEGSSHSERP
jgi:hypothetical protein